MTTEANYNNNLGYREHPAYANSDLSYLYNPKLFKDYKAGLLNQKSKDYQVIGTAFEDYLNIGIKHSETDFFDKYYVLNDNIETPGHPNQEAFAQILAGLNFYDNADIVETYGKCYSKPDEKKADALYKKLESYIQFLIDSKNKTVLKSNDLETIKKMKESTVSLPAYRELFDQNGLEILPSKRFGVETAVVIHGISWKGELDYLIFDHINKEIYIVDVKTTSSDLSFFGWAIKKYKYYRQLAHYYNLVKQSVKDTEYENWFIYVRILVAQTTGYNEAAIVPIPNNILQQGFDELEEAAEIIKSYETNNYQFRKNQKPDGIMLIDWDKLKINESEETTG